MRPTRTRARLLATLVALAAPAAAPGQTDAFSLDQPGNQEFTGLLGFDLRTLDRAVRITRIGAFDDGGDGFDRTITVRLWNRNTGAGIGTDYVFTGQVGTLVGSYRFMDLATPLEIGANTSWGIYTSGYGAGERNYNPAFPPNAPVPFDGGNLIVLERSWFQPEGAPTATQTATHYGAPNFTFGDATVSTVPEPATVMLFGGGFLVLLAAGRGRRRPT